MPEIPENKSRSIANPYKDLDKRQYWKSGVVRNRSFLPERLYKKKFSIGANTRIATAGSCFAQHIGRSLKQHNFNILDLEPAPDSLPAHRHADYGYSLYSARYGNIYTIRHLLQLANEAFERVRPMDGIWQKKDRFVDAFRPGIEPKGFKTAGDVTSHREFHLQKCRQLFVGMDLFVFTLGLTECWIHKKSGTVFPIAPGVIAGEYDREIYEFKNLRFSELIKDFMEFRELIHEMQARADRCKFLLTVSPVPLAATATENHVLSATIYSKSVLRAVAGQLAESLSDVDYFPSFELISSHLSRGMYYGSDLRSINEEGVRAVMNMFFSEHGDLPLDKKAGNNCDTTNSVVPVQGMPTDADICEEELLGYFSPTDTEKKS